MDLRLYIGFALALLAIGLWGLSSKRDMLKVLISIEIACLAAIVFLGLFASVLMSAYGTVLALFVLFVSAAETAVCAALAIYLERETGESRVDLREVKEEV